MKCSGVTGRCPAGTSFYTGFLGLAVLVLVGCTRHPPPPSLVPNEQRPVEVVTVGDANEAALLVQQLLVEPVRVEGNQLYFIAEPHLVQRLRDLHYTPVSVDIQQIERRVVRVYRRGTEEELLASGVMLINREPQYWVVNGTLAQLSALRGRGYRMALVGPDEPRPREVLIRLPAGTDPRILGPFELDIYSVRSTRDGLEVTAGAFDQQIDALRAAGHPVEQISTVPTIPR